MKKQIFFGVIFCAVCILATAQFFFHESKFFENSASMMLHPFLVAHSYVTAPINRVLIYFRSIDELQHKNRILEQEKDDALEQLVVLQAQEKFLVDTDELSAFKNRYDFSYAMLSQVLLKNFSEQEHFFLIEGGSNQGVEKNMVAIYKNNLIGRVEEVFPTYSKVLLVTDRSCKVSAYCGQSHALGIYEGSNQKQVGTVTHVSHLLSIQEGDLVISSGDGLIFPQGFALGRITYCRVNGLVYDVITQPLCDITSIGYCYLMKKGSA
ncbi:MAG TPA: rod shape-determining protein MreC [Candidatus Babeliales bacterium]|nr:rod shape-determining protein MreC [Candidatus Babeliales bacterium]